MCGARFRPCSPLSVDDPLNRHHEEGAAAVAISRTGQGSGGGAALPSSGRPHGHCRRSHDTCFPGGFRERGQRTRPECSGEPGAVVTQPHALASRTPRAGSGAGHAPPPRAHRPRSRERRLAGGQGHVLLTRPHTRHGAVQTEHDLGARRHVELGHRGAVLRCVCGITASSGTEPVSHTFVERLPCARPRGAQGGERPAGPALGWEGQGASLLVRVEGPRPLRFSSSWTAALRLCGCCGEAAWRRRQGEAAEVGGLGGTTELRLAPPPAPRPGRLGVCLRGVCTRSCSALWQILERDGWRGSQVIDPGLAPSARDDVSFHGLLGGLRAAPAKAEV